MRRGVLDRDLDRFGWNANAYTLAIEVGAYRAALRFAIRELRRPVHERHALWVARARGCFRRRWA